MEIDEMFKTQNELFTIDNSKQNEHWQLMQQRVAKNNLHKKIKFFAIAIGITALFTITHLLTDAPPAKKYIEKNIPINHTATPTNTTTSSLVAESKQPITEIITKPIVAIAKQAPSVTIPAIAELQPNFYIDLSKVPETFTIDPSINNTITCKQGTAISIPANTIQVTNNKVTVVVQEYYDYKNNTTQAGMIKYTFYDGDIKLELSNEQNIQVKLKTLTNNQILKVMRSSDVMPDATFKKMQWVTNEKFTTYQSKKTDVKVQLPIAYNANTFMSQLAFINHNAIIAGDIVNNSIVFKNVPIGETVFFTSIGKIDDKYFSCSKKLTTSNSAKIDLDFVEISAENYKKQIEELGKLGQ